MPQPGYPDDFMASYEEEADDAPREKKDAVLALSLFVQSAILRHYMNVSSCVQHRLIEAFEETQIDVKSRHDFFPARVSLCGTQALP